MLIFLQFKESVTQFAQENIAPHAAKVDVTNHFPKVVLVFSSLGIIIYSLTVIMIIIKSVGTATTTTDNDNFNFLLGC